MPVTKQNARKKLKKNRKGKLCFILAPSIACLVFFADFAIKNYLRINFSGHSFPLLGELVSITLVFNTGTAFGFLQGKTKLLIYLSFALIILFLIFYYLEKEKNSIFRVSAGLILGGAASNLFDRMLLGAVVDYIDLGFWPVFNLSDACITVGAILLIIDALIKRRNFEPNPENPHSKA